MRYQGVKDFDVHLEHKNNPVPGEWPSGRVELELEDDMSIQKVILRFLGRCRTELSETTAEEMEDKHLNLKDGEVYLDISEDCLLTKLENERGEVPKGLHSIPFTFSLPEYTGDTEDEQKLPTSVRCLMTQNGGYLMGNVKYTVKATLIQVVKDSQGSLIEVPTHETEHKEFTYVAPVSSLSLNREAIEALNRPFSFNDVIESDPCCSKPKPIISVHFAIPSRIYSTNDFIPLNLFIKNKGSDIINPIMVRLNQICTIRVQGTIRSFKKVVSQIGGTESTMPRQQKSSVQSSCGPKSKVTWDNVRFPLKHLTPHLEGCQLIDIKYFLQLKVDEMFKTRVQLFIATTGRENAHWCN